MPWPKSGTALLAQLKTVFRRYLSQPVERVRFCFTGPVGNQGQVVLDCEINYSSLVTRRLRSHYGWYRLQGGVGRLDRQLAWIEQQVPLCGFCQSGMMMKATELLEHKPNPTDAEISDSFTSGGVSLHLCRWGTYIAITDAVRHASELMAQGEV